MSVKSERDKLPVSGDLCQACHPYWRKRNMQPKYMVAVRNADGNTMMTTGGIPIVVCPHCDGNYILDLDKTEAE